MRKWLILISVVLLALLLSQVNVGQLASLLAGASLPLVLGAMAMNLLGNCFRVLKWQAFLDEHQHLSFRTLFPIQLSGIAFSNFSPGKLLEAAKAVYLKRMGFPYSFTLSSIFYERVLDVAAIFAMCALIFYQLNEELRIASIALFAIFVAIIIGFLFFLDPLLAYLSKFPRLAKAAEFKRYTFKPMSILRAAFWTVLAWFCDAVAVLFAFLALGIAFSPFALASAFALSTVIGIASFLPGGIGSSEASFAFILTLLGMEKNLAIAGSILARLVTFYWGNAVGFASSLFLPKELKESN